MWQKVGKRRGRGDELPRSQRSPLLPSVLVHLLPSLPFLIVASLAADMAYQAFECARAIYHKDATRALYHFGFIAIDALGPFSNCRRLMETHGRSSLCKCSGDVRFVLF